MLGSVRDAVGRACRALAAWVLVLAIVALVQELVRLIEGERERERERERQRLYGSCHDRAS